MKKLLSVIVIVTMLVTAMCPAFATMAADTLDISAENTYFTKNDDGNGESTMTVSVTNNPGFSDLTFVVYYDTTYVSSIEPDTASSVFGDDFITVNGARKSTVAAVKKLFTAAGLATGATIYARQIDVNYTDANGEPLNTAELGEILKFVVTSAGTYDEIPDKAVTVGYFVASASNVGGDNLEFSAPGTCAIEKDPWASFETEKTYDNFTLAAGDMNVYAGTTTVDVPVRVYNNTNEYGFLSTALTIVFPKELHLDSLIFNTKAQSVTPIKRISDDDHTDYAIQDHLDNFNEQCQGVFEQNNIDWRTLDAKCEYFLTEPTQPTVEGSMRETDALFYTLRFVLPENARPGTKYDIKVYTKVRDGVVGFVGGDGNDNIVSMTHNLGNGSIKVLSKSACDHSETEEKIVTPATCTSVGTKNIVCKLCGEIIDTVEIPMTDHTYVSSVTEPTCEKGGYTTYTCSVCNHSYTGDETDALGHVAGEKKVTVEPTYEAEGTYEIRCTRCDKVLETGSIPKLVKTTITVGDAATKPGNDIVVPVTVADNTGMFITRLTVKYDATKLTFVEAVNGEVFADATNVLFTKVEDGNLTLYFETANEADTSVNGVLANLKFTVNSDESIVGTTDITVEVEDAVNYAGKDLDIVTANGTVTIAANQKITAESREVEINKTVEVPVAIAANEGVWALRLEVAYDADLITLESIKSGLLSLEEGVNYSVKDGVITIFKDADDLANIEADGTLFTLVFKAGAATGESAIGITVLNAINNKGEDLSIKIFNGAVKVIPCKHTEYKTEVTKAPTVEEEGVLSYICTNCGETFKNEPIARLAGLTIGKVTANAGGNVAVPVTVSSNPGTYSIRMEFRYDTNALTFVNVTGGIFTADEFSASVHDGVVTVYVEADTVANVTDDGVAFTLNFTAANTAEGKYGIDGTLLQDSTVNVDGDEIAYTVVNGEVAITNNFVARIGDNYYTDLKTAFNAAVDGDTVVITKNFSYGVDESFAIYGVHVRSKKVTLDLNGHTITTDFGEGNNNWCALYLNNAELTVTGDGTITAYATTGGYVFNLVNSKLYIENGTFSGNPSVVNVESGTAYIRGGRFYTDDENKNFLVNCIDKAYKDGIANIEVTGGTFRDFDPNNCKAEGEGTDFVPVDYKSVASEEEGWFNVVPCDPHEYEVSERVESTCVVAGHITYTCKNCGRSYDEPLELADHTPGEWTVEKEPTAGAPGLEVLRCAVCGEILDSREIPALGFITKVSANNYVKSATLDGTVIRIVTSGTAISTARFAIGYTKGVTFTTEGCTAPVVRSTWAYIDLDLPCEGGKIICTDTAGNTQEYTVEVTSSPSSYKYYTAVAGGYTVDRVDDTTAADTFYVYAKPNMNNATLMLQIPAANTYTYSEGLTLVKAGNKVYFKALSTADTHEYTITITTPNGVAKTYTVYYVFDNTNIADCLGGYMVDRCEMNGDVINLTVSADYTYASFRFIFNNTTTTLVWPDDVDVVMGGKGGIHWFKIYNDGTGAVTKQFTARDTATGVVETYTVNVTFGALN